MLPLQCDQPCSAIKQTNWVEAVHSLVALVCSNLVLGELCGHGRGKDV
jgi:hypothetical protein